MIDFHYAKLEIYTWQSSGCSCNKLRVITRASFFNKVNFLVVSLNDGNGNGSLFHMTPPTSRSTIKAKPLHAEN